MACSLVIDTTSLLVPDRVRDNTHVGALNKREVPDVPGRAVKQILWDLEKLETNRLSHSDKAPKHPN
jgi:hypothetical protein